MLPSMMPFRPIYAALLFVGSLTCFGCSSADIFDLPGRYTLEDEWGNAILEISGDGTFVEEAILKNGDKKRVAGRWEYQSQRLIQKPCLGIQHDALLVGISERLLDGCSRPVTKYIGGRIGIEVSTGYGLIYMK